MYSEKKIACLQKTLMCIRRIFNLETIFFQHVFKKVDMYLKMKKISLSQTPNLQRQIYCIRYVAPRPKQAGPFSIVAVVFVFLFFFCWLFFLILFMCDFQAGFWLFFFLFFLLFFYFFFLISNFIDFSSEICELFFLNQ